MAKQKFEKDAWSLMPFGAVVGASLFVIAASLFAVCYRILLPYPISPWEAGIVTEAWRMAQGIPIYDLGSDHATLGYGPLMAVTLAQIFKFTGPTLLADRLLDAIAGLTVVATLAWVFAERNRPIFVVGLALLLIADTWSGHIFVEARPDGAAYFLALLALTAFYYGLESAKHARSAAFVATGSIVLVAAVMFKQTMAMFAIVPFVATLLQINKPFFRIHYRLILATLPIIAVAATLAVIWLRMPGLWHFLVEVQGQYPVSYTLAIRTLLTTLAATPLFGLAVIHWLLTDAPNTWRLPRVRWLLATLVCVAPPSLVAFSKAGAGENSLIPILLGIGAFCTWRAYCALTALRDNKRPIAFRIAIGTFLGILLVAQAYPRPAYFSRLALNDGDGTPDRTLVIAEVRLLPGKVVCPDDPTIPLIAKGYAGRTAVLEADRVGWDHSRQQAIIKEIRSADYVIAMRQLFEKGRPIMRQPVGWGTEDETLAANGFTKTKFRTTSSPVYELWQRAQTSNRDSATH